MPKRYIIKTIDIHNGLDAGAALIRDRRVLAALQESEARDG